MAPSTGDKALDEAIKAMVGGFVPWEKVEEMGMPVGKMYISGKYLYASTDDGVYRQRIY